ncbi:MAG: division/cell wall cluster transcriptional repressor MraZ [Actinobacteria bacterium]|nr:MAG: division/cell wall cluster transcriptional repressor MraZ [Actinomycetota bacterium]
MFLGEFQHSLDAKGRIILPSKIRSELESGLVITRAPDGCLWVMARADFYAWADRLRERARMGDPRWRDVLRFIFSGAHEDRPDRQGRISVPEHLREHAGLEREVTIAGADDRIEVWKRERWEERRAAAAARMGEDLGDLGF